MVEWPLEMIIPTHGITHIQVALLGEASGMKPRLRLLRQLCLSLERSCKAPGELPEWFQGLPSHPGSWGLWEKTASVAWTGVEDWGGWAGLLPGSWLVFPQRSCRNNCPTATDQIWWASENIFYQASWISPRLDSGQQKRQLHSWWCYQKCSKQGISATRPCLWQVWGAGSSKIAHYSHESCFEWSIYVTKMVSSI